jgi:hypothetical protein
MKRFILLLVAGAISLSAVSAESAFAQKSWLGVEGGLSQLELFGEYGTLPLGHLGHLRWQNIPSYLGVHKTRDRS